MVSYEQNKQYAEKYLAKMDEIRIRMPKESGLKDAIQEHAKITDGGSVQAFIIRAIKETMEREKQQNNVQNWHNEKEEG